MKVDNTTILSAIVGMAALLTELIFHGILTSTPKGVILSVVLAIVIICCVYFMIDGILSMIGTIHKKEENRQREFNEKLYRLLDNQIQEEVKIQKAIYVNLKLIKDIVGDSTDSGKPLTESNADLEKNMLKAAKIIVNYANKNTDELKSKLDVLNKTLEDSGKMPITAMRHTSRSVSEASNGSALDRVASVSKSASAPRSTVARSNESASTRTSGTALDRLRKKENVEPEKEIEKEEVVAEEISKPDASGIEYFNTSGASLSMANPPVIEEPEVKEEPVIAEPEKKESDKKKESSTKKNSKSKTKKKQEEVKPAEVVEEVKEEAKPAEVTEEAKEEVKPVEVVEEAKEEVKPVEVVEEVKEEAKPAEVIEEVKEEVKPDEVTEEVKEEVKPAEVVEEVKEEVKPVEVTEEVKEEKQDEEIKVDLSLLPEDPNQELSAAEIAALFASVK